MRHASYELPIFKRCLQGWSGEAWGDCKKYGTFTSENLYAVDQMLSIPIYNGWISIDYYLGENFYKAITYNINDESRPNFQYVGSKFGLASIILFPVFIIINLLLRNGLIGSKREIVVTPIISAALANNH